MCFFFFFSSRRRHTRYIGDWSSDVCSSDLAALPNIREGKLVALGVSTAKRSSVLPNVPTLAESGLPGFDYNLWVGLFAPRSEERRVGKECRARWSTRWGVSEGANVGRRDRR